MNKKARICFHIRDISLTGGTERVTAVLVNILLKYSDEYEIYVLSSQQADGAKPSFEINKRVKYARVFDDKTDLKYHMPHAITKIRRFVKQNKIDYLVSVDSILALADIPAAIGLECKTVVWEHFNFNIDMGHRRFRWARKMAAKYADYIVVLTDKDKRNFEKNLKIRNKICRIYNPINTNFAPKNYEYNAKKRKNVLVTCGRLVEQKGIDLLIETAKILKEKKVEFAWNVLGEGEDRSLLQSKINEYGLEGIVNLRGSTNNFRKFYEEAKIYVMTSRFEGLPLVLLEAQQYKLPIISFDCDCGPSEIVTDGENGYLVPILDVNSMAGKIASLLADDQKCNDFSEKSQKDFKKFNEKSIYDAWSRIFR